LRAPLALLRTFTLAGWAVAVEEIAEEFLERAAWRQLGISGALGRPERGATFLVVEIFTTAGSNSRARGAKLSGARCCAWAALISGRGASGTRAMAPARARWTIRKEVLLGDGVNNHIRLVARA
jgi:hypothetical protein